MTEPIVGNGQLIGTVHFARVGQTPAFNPHELASLGAVCTHLSVCLAGLRKSASPYRNLLAQRLTSREIQIVKLVAKGLTNAGIGAELGLLRIL